MTIDIALLELYNKVKEDSESTSEQIQAVNTVVDWINSNKKSHIENHKLFCKLYTIYFGHLITHFQDIQFAQKEIHKELSESTGYHAHWLREKINTLELTEHGKRIGLSQKNSNFMTDEELLQKEEVIRIHQKSIIEHTSKWSQEQINSSINNQVSEAINKYSHYD